MQHATCQEKGEKIWRYKFFVVSLWSKNNDRIGMKILSNTHNLLIIRRLLPPPILLILCCFAACSEDSPVALEPTNLVETRTVADSTAVSDSIVVPPIQVDTVWADTLYYDYDGNPIEPPVEFNINDIETNDAAEAV